MSVTFADVTAVKIPQGDVTKITETSTGRILWQKAEAGYPLSFICAETSGGNFTSSASLYDSITGGYTSGYTPSYNLSVQNVVTVNSYFRGNALNPQIIRSNSISAGNKFSACYVTNSSEASNVPTSAKKLSDAVWTVNDFYLAPIPIGLAITMQGYYITNEITVFEKKTPIKLSASQRPVQFSSLSGSSITVSSVVDDMRNYYRNIYETYAGTSQYVSGTDATYLYGSFQLSYTSETYRKLIGAPNHNYSAVLTFFFTIARYDN